MLLDTLIPRLLSKTPDQDDTTESFSIGSGPGAPMFEGGTHTRIRRAPVRAFASMTWEGGPREVFGQVLNISTGGCLIRTESTIEEGTTIEISVTLVGGRTRVSADIQGIVRRRTEEGGRRAYGVEFVTPSRQERETAQWLYAKAMGS